MIKAKKLKIFCNYFKRKILVIKKAKKLFQKRKMREKKVLINI